MKSENIKIGNKPFLRIDLEEINQKNHRFFVGKIKANQLIETYTVEPAKYDVITQIEKVQSFENNDQDYLDYLIEKKNDSTTNTDGFQRKESGTRIREISNFLNTEEISLFPNSIIATCETINPIADINTLDEFQEYINSQDSTIENNISYLDKENDSYSLFIPYTKSSILIIDGQHRLKGLENAKKEILKKYDLLVAILLDFDRSQIAKIFYTINYTQKSVNKSLLYHLMGEFSTEIDEITFLHEVVKILNELPASPFHKRIKMLGAASKDSPSRLQTLSQASLIDSLKGLISNPSSNRGHPPAFRYFFENEKYRIEFIRFIIKYFKAIDKKFIDSSWSKPDSSILSKTISVSALIQVMHFLFVNICVKYTESSSVKKIQNIRTDEISNFLNGIESVDLSSDGKFGQIGGGGTQNKIKRALVESITFFDSDSYDSFYKNYKNKTLKKFDMKLANIT